MQPSATPPPQWAMTIPVPSREGVTPPAGPVTVQAMLSDPDADGHQWVVLMFGDGTMGQNIRIPWQVAAGFGASIANALAQLAARAQTLAGPSLIVPPAGAQIPDLGINGHGPNGKRP